MYEVILCNYPPNIRNGFHSPRQLRITSCHMPGSAGSSFGRDSSRNMARSDQGPQSPRRRTAPARQRHPTIEGQGAEDPECPVCYDTVATVSLNCSHNLCRNCADRWFRVQPTCPMCRKIVIVGFGSPGWSRHAGPEEYRRAEILYDRIVERQAIRLAGH